MRRHILSTVFTLVCIALAAATLILHARGIVVPVEFWAFVGLALLPWALLWLQQQLRLRIKSIEFPWVGKIELEKTAEPQEPEQHTDDV
jgi:Flp pilus assembly protein TadB